jgi:ATP-binding cassette subfamily B protein
LSKIISIPDSPAQKREPVKRIRQIWGFVKPFKVSLIVAVVLTGALTFIGMVPPLLMRRLVNDVAKEGQWGIFPVVIGLLFLVPLLRAGINLGNAFSLNKVGLGLIGRTRRQIYERLMRLSMRFYNETPVGSINQRLMGDVGAISGVVTGGMITLIADVVAMGFAVTVMLGLSPKLTLLTVALLPLYYLNYWFFSQRMQQANMTLRSHMDHISSFLQERLSAHELMQSYGQEKEHATHFNSQSKQMMDTAIRSGAYSAAFTQIGAFLNKIGNTTIYCAGCYFLIKGSMEYGDVVAFGAYATSILGPVVRFSTVANQFKQVGVSIDRVNEILNREPAIQERPDAVSVGTLEGNISVESLRFAYSDGEPALEDVEMEIPAGTDVAMVGPKGAGRTTLAMLLRRFYDPTKGTIKVDGTDIRDYRLRDYREAMALVLPQSTIFDGTIRENLLYGKPDASEERMMEVSKAVGLHEFVQKLTDGYDARIGTGGLKLSTGIQQKIGVARALISEPLILIADEATASLDPESAEMINDAIWRAMENRTCIMVVHRVLMARSADTVVVMRDGQVAEAGAHEKLLSKSGSFYRGLFARQYGDDRLPPADGAE